MESLPIVLLQMGPSHPLRCSLFQVRHTNPDSPIILIGDRVNSNFPFVTFIDIEEFSDIRHRLQSVYVHKSVNSFDFELCCIERWVILSELLRKRKISRCFHMDSDVLIYTNLTDELERYSTKDMSTHTYCTLINNAEALHDFSKFIFAYYGDRSDGSLFDIDSKKHAIPSMSFNICDMSLLDQYEEGSGYLFTSLESELDGAFDSTINSSDGFELDPAGRKAVWWNEYVPYGRRNADLVRLSSLHFQGPAKPFIYDYYPMRRTVVDATANVEEQIVPSRSRISVVLLGHNEVQARQALHALSNQTIPADLIDVSLITLDRHLNASTFEAFIGAFSALNVIPLENFNSRSISRAILDYARYDLIVFYSRTVNISEHSLSAHLKAWSKDPLSIHIGRIEAAAPDSRTALSNVVETLPMRRENSFLRDGIIHPFHCFHLSNTSFSKSALVDLLLGGEEQSKPLSFIEQELGYLLWIKGYRIRATSAAPCAEHDALTYLTLIERETASAFGLNLFIERYPETSTHHFGWSDVSRNTFTEKIQEFQNNFNLPDMRSVIETMETYSAHTAITDKDFATVQYMLLVLLSYERHRIIESQLQS